MRLGKSHGDERLEFACRRALHLNAASYKSVKSILDKHLDQQPLPVSEETTHKPIVHPNIRGADYYH
jgi:hypothetical protein